MSRVRRGPNRPFVELAPEDRSTIGLWALLLAGPVIWATHFLAVYLAAEASCTADEEQNMRFLSPDALVVAVVIATVVAAAATLVAAAVAWRQSRRGEGDLAKLGWAGTVLALGSFIAVLSVGLPALAFDPC